MNFLISLASAATEEKAVAGNQILHGITNAGIVVQALLTALLCLSVWNWFIIFKKKKQFNARVIKIGVAGFCYTQLTDIEQEINGLLYYDRRPKVPVEAVKAIHDECFG